MVLEVSAASRRLYACSPQPDPSQAPLHHVAITSHHLVQGAACVRGQVRVIRLPVNVS